MIKRRRTAVLAGLAVAASAFLLPASPASAVNQDNACVNSLIPTQSSAIPIDMTATASPNPVAPGGTVTLSNITQTAAIPPAVFVAGYNAGVLVQGTNIIPITDIHTVIEGTNTVEGTQTTNAATTTATTVITDPNGIPGTGDETATPGTLSVTYADETWHAGPTDGTINFREETVIDPTAPDPPGFSNLVAGVRINAVVAGILQVRFGCDPGTVVESAPPSTIVRIDPAVTFASTEIVTPPAASNISINDVSMAEGNSGTTAFTFTVSMDAAQAAPVTVDYSTADGTATAPSDYTAASGTVTFPAGSTSQTVTVQVNGDTAVEPDETFNVNLSNVTGNATIADGTGVGTIQNDDVNLAPIANAGPDQTVGSGASVSLNGTGSSDPNGDALTYSWSQVSGPTVTLTGANTATPSFTAPTVSANTNLEFQLQVCDPSNACSTDNVVVTVTAVAASSISINDAAVTEGNSGQTAITFTVSLSAPAQPDPVTVDFATADGTATAPSDYTSTSGTVTFAPGVTAQPVTVLVNGDTTVEPNETFTVNLSNATGNATISDGTGVGTIVNDDILQVIDAAGQVIVNGPVSHTKTSKSFVFKVTNLGTGPLTVSPSDVTSSVDVNGTTTGSVSVSGLPVTLNPGASKRLKAVWSYDSALVGGETVVFNACVNVTGDIDTTNDCDSATVTAK